MRFAFKNNQHCPKLAAAWLRVIENHDVTLLQLTQELKAFDDKAPEYDWAMVYYAGDGIEVGSVSSFAAKMASACSTRSIGRGLARVEPEAGVLVAGQGRTVAQDGDGLNSPFAQSLLEHLGEAGLEINMLFRHMHDDMKARTAGQQEPFTFGALPAEALFFKAASQ